MNKTVYVPSYFQPIYKEVTVKVPTGNTKRFLGFIDIEEKIRKKEVVQEGWSDCQLAKPTYLAALSVHVSPARQGIVIGTAQALIAIADFISPVLGGLVLGYALYGVWIGIAIAVAIIGLVTAMIYLSKSSPLIVKPETK
ncbi:MFS transporter [Salmonella enterica subsp. enterica]|nr:MFS transporter [Salmonella enterica subsp. enterica]EEN8986167.1 MFS transporter [Salmonella enterica subsp. enterica]EEN9032435.1 MFS transporter [Salmonella enterica subsp. enterica]EGY1986140.1 MFS transporter [Salmonella enterica subsp. enterica serovar Meleagridis]